MAPGEMEQVILKKKDLEAYEGLETITVKIEEEQYHGKKRLNMYWMSSWMPDYSYNGKR